MRILGFDIARNPERLLGFSIKAVPGGLQSVHSGGGGWWPIVREPFTGAWQRGKEIRRENVLHHNAVYSCITLIASDIAKLRVRLVEKDQASGVWSETESSAFSPVLRKPNRYQNRIQFYTQWIVSKISAGNTYVLKGYDERRVVNALYVLDPFRCKPLVAPDGAVYYEIKKDNLTGLQEDNIIVPASEIIHDVMVPLYHPLCGVSPIVACWLAAQQGLSIQEQSANFFSNRATPGGILTAPGWLDDTKAQAYKDRWEANYGASGAGKVAVLGDGLKFEPISITAQDSQLVEQLKWSAETVCSCFHVPPYMVGVGPMPTYNNIEALNQQYYTQCLQSLIESIELCLDEGLGLDKNKEGKTYGTEFDLDDLLRMDTATKVKTAVEGLKGIFAPNEARKKFDLRPLPGGDSVYMQQQNYSLEALNKRDSKDDPFESGSNSVTPATPTEADNDNSPEALAATRQMARWIARDMLAA